jgi:flavin-binding protein dodecin
MAQRKTSKPLFSSKKIGHAMSTVAKVIELTAASPKSIEDAIESGIKRADSTLDQIEGAWVQDIKCVVKNGKVSEWRVNLKVTFLLK